jgi:hypothetical protein
MSDLAIIISAAVGALTPVGAGVAFLWRKFETLQRDVNDCKQHRGRDQERMRLTTEICFELCTNGVPPKNPSVAPLARTLRATWSLEEPISQSWLELLDQIDGKRQSLPRCRRRASQETVQ